MFRCGNGSCKVLRRHGEFAQPRFFGCPRQIAARRVPAPRPKGPWRRAEPAGMDRPRRGVADRPGAPREPRQPFGGSSCLGNWSANPLHQDGQARSGSFPGSREWTPRCFGVGVPERRIEVRLIPHLAAHRIDLCTSARIDDRLLSIVEINVQLLSRESAHILCRYRLFFAPMRSSGRSNGSLGPYRGLARRLL